MQSSCIKHANSEVQKGLSVSAMGKHAADNGAATPPHLTQCSR